MVCIRMLLGDVFFDGFVVQLWRHGGLQDGWRTEGDDFFVGRERGDAY